MLFCYNVDGMPQELISCLYQLTRGKISFIICRLSYSLNDNIKWGLTLCLYINMQNTILWIQHTMNADIREKERKIESPDQWR